MSRIFDISVSEISHILIQCPACYTCSLFITLLLRFAESIQSSNRLLTALYFLLCRKSDGSLRSLVTAFQ